MARQNRDFSKLPPDELLKEMARAINAFVYGMTWNEIEPGKYEVTTDGSFNAYGLLRRAYFLTKNQAPYKASTAKTNS